MPAAEMKEGYTGDIQAFPLKFDSLDQEINFHCTLQMLNFGSAYQDLLDDRSVFETIQYGMLGLMLSGRKMNAQMLSSMSLSDVGQTFGVEVKREAKIKPDTPIYTEEDTEVAGFAKLILKACEDTGRRLRELDCEDFAQFFRKFLDVDKPTASAFVFVLQKQLPVFCDGYTTGDTEIYVLSKAKLLAAELHRRFSFRAPLFDFQDMDRLGSPMGNAIPALLRSVGVLSYDPELSRRVDERRSVTGDLEMELRCVAVHACHQIAEAVEVNGAELYLHLRNVAEKAEFASAPRHLTPNTLFF
uniref:Queuosine 5'-phosphate N-glycosylase/hydrolase n=1 Tax=Eutreptiella gymnastica TaxID=73025 RepID=A0A7S4CFK6_9EUGL